jgi:putative CocE/NonD family hydrolase
MTEFTFYQSGLEFGRFRAADGAVQVQWGDETTFTPLTATRSKELAVYGNIDFLEVLGRWQEGAFDGHANDDAFTTDWGAQYQRRSEHYWVNREHKYPLDLIEDAGQIVGFQVPFRDVTAVLVQPEYVGLTAIKLWQDAGYSQQPLAIAQKFDVMIPQRDGAKLSATVLLPAGDGPFHTVMQRTPYGRETYVAMSERYVKRGYAVVLQDVRGRGDSEGEWVPMVHEEEDGSDTIDWIAQQDWSTGRVGMIGGSYGGYVQWAAAASGNPHLNAIVSMVTAGGPFSDTYYRQGAPFVAQVAWSFATDSRHFDASLTDRDDWDKLDQIRPLKDIPVVGLGHEIPGFSAFMKHNRYDDFIERGDWHARADKITVPAFIQSGWYDDDGIGTTEALDATKDYARGQRRILLGPWLHGGNAQYDLGPTHLGPYAVRADVDLLHQQWFDHFLDGQDNGVNEGPLCEYYTVGEEAWHTADTFPPAGATQQLFLDAPGQLREVAPTAAGTRSYDHDPANPVPKLISVTQNEFEFPADYSQVEQRPDVITFTTPALQKALRIVGQVQTDLFASSSAVDCDWVVRILDVFPDGQSVQIADGCMNAKFRDSLSDPELLKPGEVYHFILKSQKTSYQLAAGHKLRVDVQSSADGFIFPNDGTADGFATTDSVIATQTVYTGGEHASYISFTSDEAVK